MTLRASALTVVSRGRRAWRSRSPRPPRAPPNAGDRHICDAGRPYELQRLAQHRRQTHLVSRIQRADANPPVAVSQITAEGATDLDCGVRHVAGPGPWRWSTADGPDRQDRAPAATGSCTSRPPDGNGLVSQPRSGRLHRRRRACPALHSCTAPTTQGLTARARVRDWHLHGHRRQRERAASFALRYDSAGPVVKTGKPARKPDRRGWYIRPVRWSFTGTDALSGLAACPAVRYSGPDGGAARVVGACADRAGNITYRGFPIRYDDTAPPPPDVSALPRDRAVRLKIRVAPDVRRIRVVRAPGRGGARDSTIYRGRPRNLKDVHLRNYRRYRYTVVATDRAGPPVAQGVGLRRAEARAAGAAERSRADVSADAALVEGRRRGLLQRAAVARRQEGPVCVADKGAASAQAPLALRGRCPADAAGDVRVERLARLRAAPAGELRVSDRQGPDVRHPGSIPSAVRSSTGSSNEHEP